MEEFNADDFLDQVNQAAIDNRDYRIVHEEIMNTLEKLLHEGKIQNKCLILAIGTLLSAKTFIEFAFPSEKDRNEIYKNILKIKDIQ